MPTDISETGLGRRALCRSVIFIEKHLSEPLTLADLADAACLSAGHFSRMFKLRTGRTPMAYIRWRRVEHAKHLLNDESTRAADIAIQLGFFDQSHFCRCFRQETGVSPGRYARRLPDTAIEKELYDLLSSILPYDSAVMRGAHHPGSHHYG